MIPKIIHYCWFGGNPLPPLAEKCIESWKKYLPDYEIKRWDESNFDVNILPYTREANEARKYAFLSDFARFWILYHHGGLYFDTDVEVIRPMDDIIAAGPFMGCQEPYRPGQPPSSLEVAPGLGLGVPPGFPLYREILDLYGTLRFRNSDGSLNQTTVVDTVTGFLCKKGLINTPAIQEVEGIKIYPQEYFSPRTLLDDTIVTTGKTVSIHHFAASWLSDIELTSLQYERKLLFLPYNIRIYICKFIAFYKVKGIKAAVCQTGDRIARIFRSSKN